MEVEMQAIPTAKFVPKFGLFGIGAKMVDNSLGTIVADTNKRTLLFELSKDVPLDEMDISIHGFAPPGWSSDPLAAVPMAAKAPVGTWAYSEAHEKNVLAGLSYFVLRSKKTSEVVLRAQIEPKVRPVAKLEDFVTLTGLAGSCNSRVTID